MSYAVAKAFCRGRCPRRSAGHRRRIHDVRACVGQELRRAAARAVGHAELGGAGRCNSTYAPNIHGSIGVTLPGSETRMVALEDATVTLQDGEPGELMIRGPLEMPGYFGNEAATRQTIEPSGCMHTGDIATCNAEGHFFIVDRNKDMILTGGYNVYPAELERVIALHPAVAMVAVGPIEDEIKGELARACIVLRPGSSAIEGEIIDHCRPNLAAYKLPRSVRFVADLPRTSTGKVVRGELRKLDV